MGKTWSDDAAAYVTDWGICPRCGHRPLQGAICSNCGAELGGAAGAALADASRAVAAALRERQRIIDRLPVHAATDAGAQGAVPVPAAAAAPAAAAPAPAPAASTVAPPAAAPRSSVSVQSVLSVTGAGLLAVAAIVFTFFNPDLTSFTARTSIIAVVTALFLAGAWWLKRRALRFSAESVAALAAVFALIDIWAFTEVRPEGVPGSLFSAIGTLFMGGVLLVAGTLSGIRAWLLAAIAGLPCVPLLFLLAADWRWAWVLGCLGAVVVVLLLHELLRPIGRRLGSSLRAEHGTAAAVQLIAGFLVPLLMLFTPLEGGHAGWVLASAGVLAAVAAGSALAARVVARRVFSGIAGAYAVLAIAVLPLATDDVWPWLVLAALPTAASAVFALSTWLPLPRFVAARTVRLSAWITALVLAVPSLLFVLGSVAFAVLRVAAAFRDRADAVMEGIDQAPVAAAAGVASIAVSAWLTRRSRRSARPAFVLSGWAALAAVAGATAWSGLPMWGNATVGVGAAFATAVVVWRMPRRIAPALRRPLVAAGHVLLVLGVVLSWVDDVVTVWAGAAAIVVLVPLALARPRSWRPWYTGVGYAYGLVVLAVALGLTPLEPVQILCLVTTAASALALAATVATVVDGRHWLAVLLVTAVPFLLAVAAVIGERSGWTSLSTAMTVALLIVLTLTRRAGMTGVLRAVSAGLVVPALSVLVTCLGAWLLETSGSPIVLPVVAAIIAIALMTAVEASRALVRLGIPSSHVRGVRLAVEATAAVTAVIAVALSLWRVAAGLGTTFLVLVILGIGYTVFGVIAHRRYAYAFGGVAFTGALWSALGLADVRVPEAYLAPPGAAAALIGGLLLRRPRVARDRAAALGLLVGGLNLAVLPSLGILLDPGSDAPWRVIGLVAAAVLLIVGGALLRSTAVDAAVRRWVLVAAVVASAAPVLLSLRWAFGADAIGDDALMPAALGVSGLAAALAAAAGLLLPGRAGRWRFAAALVFLIVGPCFAVRDAALLAFAPMLLGLALLLLMLWTVVLTRTGPVYAPPAWFTFALAWCTMVAAWSDRSLRVEAYSVPLGVALIGAGLLAIRPAEVPVRRGWTSWPVGFTDSWRLLGPGLVVLILPSVLATGTDPQTWRAITVMSLALAAVLIGSLARLAAPFFIGLATIPVEIAVVFLVQLGRSISPLLWWITLAAAGAVLLVIAVTSERKGSSGGGFAARMHDLT